MGDWGVHAMRVKIIGISEDNAPDMSELAKQYYEQFIGQEYAVVDIDYQDEAVLLNIPTFGSKVTSDYTWWYPGEYEYVQEASDEN